VAGYNILWLMRAIARRGRARLFCALSAVLAKGQGMLMARQISPRATGSNRSPPCVVSAGWGTVLSLLDRRGINFAGLTNQLHLFHLQPDSSDVRCTL
jgi:hypothetical protein